MCHAPKYTCTHSHLHLCEKRKWLCALCVIVLVLSPPQEKVCVWCSVCAVAGGLPHWARTGQLRCQRHDGEGPPSQEASSCQVFSSLCTGLHISWWSEVRVMCEEKAENHKIYSGGRRSGVKLWKVRRCSFSRTHTHTHTSQHLWKPMWNNAVMRFVHFYSRHYFLLFNLKGSVHHNLIDMLASPHLPLIYVFMLIILVCFPIFDIITTKTKTIIETIFNR